MKIQPRMDVEKDVTVWVPDSGGVMSRQLHGQPWGPPSSMLVGPSPAEWLTNPTFVSIPFFIYIYILFFLWVGDLILVEKENE